MSRVGKQPVPLTDGVKVEIAGNVVTVKGPKGELSERLPSLIQVQIGEKEVTFTRPDDKKVSKSLHGLARALVANMVKGVVVPFVKQLEIQGVGYRAEADAKTLKMQLGFSHPVEVAIPTGIKVAVDRNVNIEISGISRQLVGQFAADVRSIRPPEPYKGKGVRYVDEHVRRKVGKSGATGTGA